MENKQDATFDLGVTSLGELSATDYSLAVLPWGATEPHNLHLPYLTDCFLAKSIALDAAHEAYTTAGVRCMVLPPVTLGAQNIGQWQQPFCIHTRYETQKAILTDVVASLRIQGFCKLVIVNGHGGNSFKNMIRDLAFDFPDFLIAVVDWFAVVPQAGYFENRDDHAGEMETSVLMHYHPELVDLATAGDGGAKPFAVSSLNEKVAWVPRNWARVSADTGIGNPHRSSAEKGARYASAVVGKVTNLLVELSQTLDIYPE